MSRRLEKLFSRCRDENRAALVGYLTAGDPNPEVSGELLKTLATECDIIEIGMPFSDPMADGPVIQAAGERALAAGTHIDDVFALTKSVRDALPDLGIVLMGYANIPFAMGFDHFAERAEQAGADAVLLVDIPPEEGGICDAAFRAHNLDRILLLSPTSTDERIRLACEYGSGFIYYVSLTGITGAEMGDVAAIRDKVSHIRQVSERSGNPMPVCVGFGVKTAAQAADVAGFADGVVVGSHFVSHVAAMDQGNREACIAELADSATSMRIAVARRNSD